MSNSIRDKTQIPIGNKIWDYAWKPVKELTEIDNDPYLLIWSFVKRPVAASISDFVSDPISIHMREQIEELNK